MKIYSYLIDHDLGLAPNPFGNYCTLAVCKPRIRKSGNLKVGDWIIGTGSKALEKLSGKEYVGKLIYAMQVDEILTLEQYWHDDRFQYKKPNLNGTLEAMYGDNIYHKDENGNWVQSDSAHSFEGGVTNQEHLITDTAGKNVLISRNFYYFGSRAPLIPSNLKAFIHSTQGEKIVSADIQEDFINWLQNFRRGISGYPISWIIYKRKHLF